MDSNMPSGNHFKPATSQTRGKGRVHAVPTKVLAILLIVLVVVVCIGVYLIVSRMDQAQQAAAQAAQMSAIATADATTSTADEADDKTVSLVDNPIDFAALKATNSDIYAWIKVPNTNIDYAIVQSPTDDTYYQTHDAEGDESVYGAVWTEMANSESFTDPVTVIYGHRSDYDLMFSTLHNFEDSAFFADNEYFYIYAPGHIYTYEIISAFMYDTRHILNSFNFSEPSEVKRYDDDITVASSIVSNKRDVAVTTTDKIVTLSTCMPVPYRLVGRYIVSGVLVDDQLTN